MSWETQSWAAKQRPGSASAKLVLLGLASCADQNHCAFPSVAWLCDFGDLNRKTVIAAIQRLEDGMFPLIEDTGERRGRTGQVKVYRLAAASAENASSDPASQSVPKAEQFQKRNSSVSTRKQSQKRDTEPVSNLKPPLSSKDDKTPAPKNDDGLKKGSGRKKPDRKKRGTRLADDWEPPAIDDLSAVAVKLVRQWPSGAYQAVGEAFRLHYQSETGPQGIRPNWNDVLSKWVIGDHAKIMRDAKAGVSFADLVPRPVSPATPPASNRPVKAKEQEDERSEAMHALLRRRLGAQIYDSWLAKVALIHDGQGITVVVGSEFQRGWIEERFHRRIGDVAREVAGKGIKWVRFEVEHIMKNKGKKV